MYACNKSRLHPLSNALEAGRGLRRPYLGWGQWTNICAWSCADIHVSMLVHAPCMNVALMTLPPWIESVTLLSIFQRGCWAGMLHGEHVVCYNMLCFVTNLVDRLWTWTKLVNPPTSWKRRNYWAHLLNAQEWTKTFFSSSSTLFWYVEAKIYPWIPDFKGLSTVTTVPDHQSNKT